MISPIARVAYFRFSSYRLVDVFLRCAFLSILVIATAALGGRLVPEDGLTTIWCDIGRALTLPSLHDCTRVTAFPLARDYASLFHIAMIAIMGTFGGALISDLREFWRSAGARGILLGASPSDLKWINRVDGGRTHPLADIAILGVGIAMCYVGALGYAANGIYPSLAQSENPAEFAKAAASLAWNAFPLPGFFSFIIVGALGNYYILQIGIAAVSSLLLGLRASQQGRLRLLPLSVDGKWGWDRIFTSVNNGIATSVFGLLGLLCLLLRGGYNNLPYLLAFPLVAALGVLPWTVINRLWARAVDRTVAARGEQIDQLTTGKVLLVHIEYLSLRAVPARIVSPAAAFFQLSFTVLPGVLAFSQVSGLWK